MPKLLTLLYDKHDRVASLAAQFFYEVSPNAEAGSTRARYAVSCPPKDQPDVA